MQNGHEPFALGRVLQRPSVCRQHALQLTCILASVPGGVLHDIQHQLLLPLAQRTTYPRAHALKHG